MAADTQRMPMINLGGSIDDRESFMQMRKNLEESRKIFLNLIQREESVQETPAPSDNTSTTNSKKDPAPPATLKRLNKKISFKIRKNSSIYTHRRPSREPKNNVQELARKYNELEEKMKQQSSLSGSPKLVVVKKSLVKRKSSFFKQDKPLRESPSSKVKTTVAIFEQKSSTEKPQVPEKSSSVKAAALRNQERLRRKLAAVSIKVEEETEECGDESLQIINIPMRSPRSESNYETRKLSYKSCKFKNGVEENSDGRVPPLPPRLSKINEQFAQIDNTQIQKDVPVESSDVAVVGETLKIPKPEDTPKIEITEPNKENDECDMETYEIIEECLETVAETEITKIEKAKNEPIEFEDDYEICDPNLNIYETLESVRKPRKQDPLPPRPVSRNSSTISSRKNKADDGESNYYESIDSRRDYEEANYESIYGGSRKRDSISARSDSNRSNSIYGRSITSWAEEVFDTFSQRRRSSVGSVQKKNGLLLGADLNRSSSSDVGSSGSASNAGSDDWVDISDHEHESPEHHRSTKYDKRNGFVVVSQRPKLSKKISGWSQQLRDQWNKAPRKPNKVQGDSDSDHHYETLHIMQAHHEGFEDTNQDVSDSFDSDCDSENSFAKNDSGVDMSNAQLPEPPVSNNQTYAFTKFAASAGKNVMRRLRRNWSLRKNDISKSLSRITKRKSRTDLDSLEHQQSESGQSPTYQRPTDLQLDKNSKTFNRRGFLDKFRRSMSLSGDSPESPNSITSDRPKSTFYLTDAIIVDDTNATDHKPKSPVKSKGNLVRPQIPPPPTPTNRRSSSSWYAECGLFEEQKQQKTANSFWYAEVGLYQGSLSAPSTSSEENSGNNRIINTDQDEYYNVNGSKNYYNDSIKSFDSTDTKKDEAFNSLPEELQLRLQDEPLYQFYDAAVVEDGMSYYDDYEEMEKKSLLQNTSAGSEHSFSNNPAVHCNRPTAMEIVSSPSRSSISVSRTLWCEIPEVINSTVLSTLNIHQKKLQEAKFEMLTSEASYLNSLSVLTGHFLHKLNISDLLNEEEKEILCGKIMPVKECSEKLLFELEKCWQDNILLHGVCDIVKKHAENNFGVYVSYCENQIILDHTLKRLKEKPAFCELLKQLEANSVCQLLSFHSFLMLPMQRITRWPLLVDAILKRLSQQDDEYISSQHALATLNKIVNQCNEGARRVERATEMQKVSRQLEFPCKFDLLVENRWLVKWGPLTQMQNRGEDVKLTFGKRFTKIPLHLFLFNDILVVAKSKGDGFFTVLHYCSRSYVELNTDSLACLPAKDSQGRHLIFLTILENHEEKTVELLLSCNSETDKERWLEALSPPKSENPDETLYECWDCPQVTAIYNYIPIQADELPLTRGDTINVTRKMKDGWYNGERIRDGKTGWFPANHTVEVANPHVRARNLKQRYRLLAFSENYVKSK